jgi:hypothetical protein
MRQKGYAVTIYFRGSKTYFVESPDYGEAEDVASDEFGNDIGDLGEYTEITDIESELDND